MKIVYSLILGISLILFLGSCQQGQDGPMAVDNEDNDFLKAGDPASRGKDVRVAKAVCEGCHLQEVYWSEKDFDLPDFDLNPFTITSVEVRIMTSNETANFNAKLFRDEYRIKADDRQLSTVFSWEGEYPEEHPCYEGFQFKVSSNEVLEDVEAICSVTYTMH